MSQETSALLPVPSTFARPLHSHRRLIGSLGDIPPQAPHLKSLLATTRNSQYSEPQLDIPKRVPMNEVKQLLAQREGIDMKMVFFLYERKIIGSEETWQSASLPSVQVAVRTSDEGITMKIETSEGSFLTKVALTDTVQSLKEKLQLKSGIDTAEQLITRGKRVINDSNLQIENLGLMSGHVLQLRRKLTASFLYIKPTNWWTNGIETELSGSVRKLKSEIHEKLGYLTAEQVLMTANGQILGDSNPLSSYNLTSGDSVRLKYSNSVFLRTISVYFPNQLLSTFTLNQHSPLSLLELQVAAQLPPTASLFLATADHSVVTHTSRALAKVPTTLYVRQEDSALCVLVECTAEFGKAHLVVNASTVGEVKEVLNRHFHFPSAKNQVLVKDEEIVGNEQEIASLGEKVCLQLILPDDEITLYVHKQGEAWIAVTLIYSSHIHDIKAQIETLEGVSTASQVLMYEGKELENDKSLLESGLLSDSVLLLLICRPALSSEDVEKLHLWLRMPAGHLKEWNGGRGKSIGEIKQEIREKGLISTQIALYRHGKEMLDSQTLASIGLKTEETLTVLAPDSSFKPIPDSVLTTMRKLQVKQNLQFSAYALCLDGQAVPPNPLLPLPADCCLRPGKGAKGMRTNCMYLAAALSAKLKPVYFFPKEEESRVWSTLPKSVRS